MPKSYLPIVSFVYLWNIENGERPIKPNDKAMYIGVIDTLNNTHTVTWQINGTVEMENAQILGNAATLREAILKCLYFIAKNGGTYTGYDY